MLDPNRPPKQDRSPAGNIVAAVLLTIFAIPMLLVAGCMPAVILTVIIPNVAVVIGVLSLAAIVLCAALAYHADSTGVRIGFIAAAIEIALFTGWISFFKPWW